MSRISERNYTIRIKKTRGNIIPPAPPGGNLDLFARDRAGRMLLHLIGPAGIDVGLQPALFGNSVYQYTANSGAGTTVVPLSMGLAPTARVAGTGATNEHIAPASTNDGTSLTGIQFDTGTTTTGSAGFQTALLPFWRGNAAGRGGWFLMCRFSPITLPVTTYQLLIGLSALNAALAGEPSSQNNTIALAKDSTDTNFQFLLRDGTTANKTNTGVAPAAGSVYDLLMFAPPNGSNVTMRLANAMTGAILFGDSVLSTNIPSNTTFMAAHFQLRATTGTSSKEVRMNKMYIETDL